MYIYFVLSLFFLKKYLFLLFLLSPKKWLLCSSHTEFTILYLSRHYKSVHIYYKADKYPFRPELEEVYITTTHNIWTKNKALATPNCKGSWEMLSSYVPKRKRRWVW